MMFDFKRYSICYNVSSVMDDRLLGRTTGTSKL